jgi:MarR family transcriptional regulator for hemolysin
MGDEGALGADRRHALVRSLSFAAKAARDYLEHRLSSAGSGFAVWTALSALRAKGPLIQRELARLLNVEGPTLTRHLARMETQGLVERHRTSADRRATVVRLTPAGEAAHDRLATVVAAGGDIVLEGFSPREIEEFAGYLNRLIANVESACPARRHAPVHD